MTFSQRDNDLRILKEQLRKMDLRNGLKELEAKMEDLQWKGQDQKALLNEVFNGGIFYLEEIFFYL